MEELKMLKRQRDELNQKIFLLEHENAQKMVNEYVGNCYRKGDEYMLVTEYMVPYFYGEFFIFRDGNIEWVKYGDLWPERAEKISLEEYSEAKRKMVGNILAEGNNENI